jgi:hypothetical protein
MVESEGSRSVPDIPTKPDCRVRAITELPKYFVAAVEYLTNMDGIELIMAVVRETLLFQRYTRVDSCSVKTFDPASGEVSCC